MHDHEIMKDKEVQKANAAKMERIEQIVHMTVKEYSEMSRAANKSKKPLQIPSIRFHGGANLAVIIGESEAVAVAAKVIGALPGAQRSVAASARESDTFRDPVADELNKRARPDGNRPAAQR
jgi:hypothetical protein